MKEVCCGKFQHDLCCKFSEDWMERNAFVCIPCRVSCHPPTVLSFTISVYLPCREFRKKMEVAKARVHTLKKKQKEAEKTAEVMNVTQTNSKR